MASAACLPVLAGDDVPLVKAVLTDMSVSIGMEPAGHGMMGAGTMGQDPVGGGQMGLGMMRPGNMTGVLAVRIDRPGVKAGSVRFDVTNRSRAMPHEVLIVAVDDPLGPLPYDYSQAKVADEQVKVLGDTDDLQPGASGTIDVTLAPGSYLLICNEPGHYAAGMVTPFTVTP